MQNFGTIIDNFDAVTKQYVDDKASAKRIKGIKVDNATLADTANKVKNAFTYKVHNKTEGTVLPITYDGIRAASLDFSANDFTYDYNSFNNITVKLVNKGYATKTYVDNQDALKLDKAGGSITGNLTVGGNLTIGLPQVNCLDMNGKPLENQQLDPDVEVYITPEQMMSGDDEQLKRAIDLMLETVK